MLSFSKMVPTACAGSLLLFLLLLGACSGADSADNAPDTGDEGMNAGGAPPMPSARIEFETQDTLTLNPQEVTVLSVAVEPVESQVVTFEILTEEPDFDGFLMGGSVGIDSNGRASIELRAPSIASTFMVRASVTPESFAVLTVAVSSSGFGRITVTPEYDGQRKIENWTSSARVGVRCEEIPSLWSDGPLTGTDEDPQTIFPVPAGAIVAVLLRGDELAAGCVTIADLEQNEERTIALLANDRPIDIGMGSLDIALEIQEASDDFTSRFETDLRAALSTLTGSDESEAQAFLGALETSLSEPKRGTFAAISAEQDFEAGILSAWRDDRSALSRAFFERLFLGTKLISNDGSLRGTLSLRSDNSGLTLTDAAGVDPKDAGFEPRSAWVVQRQNADRLALGGVLTVSPFRWLEALEGELDPQWHPSEALQCDSVAKELAERATATALDCDEECMGKLCGKGADLLWKQTLNAGSEPPPVTLVISMSAEAQLFGAAEVVSMEGSWIGRFGDSPEDSVSTLSGRVVGVTERLP